jgi:twitching motility protein PilU
LVADGVIDRDEALAHADSPTNLMWKLDNEMEPTNRAPQANDEAEDQAVFTEFVVDVV